MTILENITRVLQHYGLENTITITKSDEDRVWAWPVSDVLLVHCVLNRWYSDIAISEEHFHGTGSCSFREPHVHPSMQVVFHPNLDQTVPIKYFIELDVDEYIPSGLALPGHVFEVTRNTVTGRKTNQDKISKLLDTRFCQK